MAWDDAVSNEMDLEKAMQRLTEDAAADIDVAMLDRYPTRFWYSIQAFLGACANISKLLWPRESKWKGESPDDLAFRIRRGELLLASVGLTNESPLHSRELRNAFEHMDERLDRWARTSERHMLFGRNIGTPGGFVSVPPLGPNDTVGYYDRAARTVAFPGDPIPLVPMIEAVRQLAATLQRR
jgi:hypothetical protein